LNRPAFLLIAPVLALAPARALPQEIVKHVGAVTFRVDGTRAFPGGVMVVRLSSRRALGTAFAILDGRRSPFYLTRGVPRALVPVALGAQPGPNTLGVEIVGRRGRQRIPVAVQVSARTYPPRVVAVPADRSALLRHPALLRDGRRLLGVVRTQSPGDPRGLAPPITIVPGLGFGGEQTWLGGPGVESLTDAVFGEQHRGLDFAVPAGTVVMAPAAGTVLFAGPLALSGDTLVIDHGHGVVSALFHLSRLDVAAGDAVEPRAPVGLSGDTGMTATPLLQWRTYVHGVAVDPTILQQVLN
jgi:Peptidase family M23